MVEQLRKGDVFGGESGFRNNCVWGNAFGWPRLTLSRDTKLKENLRYQNCWHNCRKNAGWQWVEQCLCFVVAWVRIVLSYPGLELC